MRFEQQSGGRLLLACVVLVPLVTVVACGGGDMPAEPAMEEPMSEPVADAAPATGGAPRVFFVSPDDGATISSDFDLQMEFGIENYEISPIPEEFETPRSDVGHFHVGVDTDCLPVGEIIPQGEGWVHFGDGSNTFALQVEAGSYQLSLQLGDDEHRTLEGLCESISVEIADGV